MIPTTAPVTTLSVEALRDRIAALSTDIRIKQAELAEYTAELVERERRLALEAGRSEKAAALGATQAVQKLAGVTRTEARGLVEVGTVLNGRAEALWMAAVGDATRDGSLSVTKASAIRFGLGDPNDRVSAEDLLLATTHLVEVARDLTPEQLERETRAVREQLDHQYVVSEERRIQDARSAKLFVRPDGSGHLSVELDREATVVVSELLSNATGPRTGAPRFVSTEGKAYQQAIKDDPRATQQLAHDALLMVIKAGLSADPGKLPGRQPAVRVLVTATDLKTRAGYGELEGTGQTVSIETVEGIACESGIEEVPIDPHGNPTETTHRNHHPTTTQAVQRETTTRPRPPRRWLPQHRLQPTRILVRSPPHPALRRRRRHHPHQRHPPVPHLPPRPPQPRRLDRTRPTTQHLRHVRTRRHPKRPPHQSPHPRTHHRQHQRSLSPAR